MKHDLVVSVKLGGEDVAALYYNKESDIEHIDIEYVLRKLASLNYNVFSILSETEVHDKQTLLRALIRFSENSGKRFNDLVLMDPQAEYEPWPEDFVKKISEGPMSVTKDEAEERLKTIQEFFGFKDESSEAVDFVSHRLAVHDEEKMLKILQELIGNKDESPEFIVIVLPEEIMEKQKTAESNVIISVNDDDNDPCVVFDIHHARPEGNIWSISDGYPQKLYTFVNELEPCKLKSVESLADEVHKCGPWYQIYNDINGED